MKRKTPGSYLNIKYKAWELRHFNKCIVMTNNPQSIQNRLREKNIAAKYEAVENSELFRADPRKPIRYRFFR